MKITQPPVTFPTDRCFACSRKLAVGYIADTRDGQLVTVGPECLRKVLKAGNAGFQPLLGGPRLWLCQASPADVRA